MQVPRPKKRQATQCSLLKVCEAVMLERRASRGVLSDPARTRGSAELSGLQALRVAADTFTVMADL